MTNILYICSYKMTEEEHIELLSLPQPSISYPKIDPDIQKSCRICLEESDSDNMIAPCACSGHSAWVHRHCLDEWRGSNSRSDALTKCPTCKQDYVIEYVDNRAEQRKANMICIFRIVIDLNLLLLAMVGLYGLCFLAVLGINKWFNGIGLWQGANIYSESAVLALIIWIVIGGIVSLIILIYYRILHQMCDTNDLLYCGDSFNCSGGAECVFIIILIFALILVVGIVWIIYQIVRNRIHVLYNSTHTQLYIVQDLSLKDSDFV